MYHDSSLNRSGFAVALCLLLCLVGCQSRVNVDPQPASDTAQTPKASHVRDAALTDFSLVPIYPEAVLTSQGDESLLGGQRLYTTSAEWSSVKQYYEEALTNSGWRLSFAQDKTQSQYLWSDPDRSLPWHLELSLTIEPLAGGDGTSIGLAYARFPDISDNLPLYPGGHSIELQEARKADEPGWGGYPTRIITKTFVVDADIKAIETYYNDMLPRYGWSFYELDTFASNPTQTGSISAPDGLVFQSLRTGSSHMSVIRTYLSITASAQEDGQRRIRLSVQETERNLLMDTWEDERHKTP